jgi:hypothetical protein
MEMPECAWQANLLPAPDLHPGLHDADRAVEAEGLSPERSSMVRLFRHVLRRIAGHGAVKRLHLVFHPGSQLPLLMPVSRGLLHHELFLQRFFLPVFLDRIAAAEQLVPYDLDFSLPDPGHPVRYGLSGRRKKRPELFNNCAYNETELDIFSKPEFL